MKASTRQQLILLQLQDLDTSLARLRHRRGQLPERAELTHTDADYASAKEQFMARQRVVDALLADLSRFEADTTLVRDRLARDEQLIVASSSTKEVQALQSEIDTLRRRQSELEDRELELMEEQETAEAQLAEATEALNAVQEQRAILAQRIQASEVAIDAEYASVADERRLLSAELERELLELYEETRARTGIGAARLRGNVSEGSNMALAPAELAEIRAAAEDEIVFCPGSGAILVRIADEEAE